MPAPKNISELRRFLGMVNHFSKFTPCLADKTKPLRDLLVKDHYWVWGEMQQNAFEHLRQMLTSSPVLALFNSTFLTVASADASYYGPGGVLLQQQPQGSLQPVAYISRLLTTTEQRYAQIEKEPLALIWACEYRIVIIQSEILDKLHDGHLGITKCRA